MGMYLVSRDIYAYLLNFFFKKKASPILHFSRRYILHLVLLYKSYLVLNLIRVCTNNNTPRTVGPKIMY